MTQKVDAIYTDGVLKPTRELSLKDNQRVRLTVETIDDPSRDRQAAIGRLKAGIASMRFFSEGPLPSREELHDHHPFAALSSSAVAATARRFISNRLSRAFLPGGSGTARRFLDRSSHRHLSGGLSAAIL
jgi:predicted DNA-binding antitoxin AbrB/MazE fold protein